MRPVASIGHTLPGLLVFCLPAGAALLAAFHLIVKRPATLLLPDALRTRIAGSYDCRRLVTRDMLRIAGLILVGAATHIAWDSFTHAGGWAVRRWSPLSAVVFTAFATDIRVYKLLQHASTVVGLSALVVAIARWLQRQSPAAALDSAFSPAVRWVIVAAIVTAAVAAGGVWASIGPAADGAAAAFQIAIGRFVVASIAGFALALVAFSVTIRTSRRLARR